VTTNALDRQWLKPFSIQTLYGTVETVPYKDFLVATQALKPNPKSLRIARLEAAAHNAYLEGTLSRSFEF